MLLKNHILLELLTKKNFKWLSLKLRRNIGKTVLLSHGYRLKELLEEKANSGKAETIAAKKTAAFIL